MIVALAGNGMDIIAMSATIIAAADTEFVRFLFMF
jgi:hypothetical protein